MNLEMRNLPIINAEDIKVGDDAHHDLDLKHLLFDYHCSDLGRYGGIHL